MSSIGQDFSVADALKNMELTDSFKKFVIGNRALWSTFGKMDSTQYRKKLMKLMTGAKLAPEQQVAVFFLFSVVKKKSRVIDGLSHFTDAQKAQPWFEPVRAFIAEFVTDYNTNAKAPDRFPGTHIPSCNPGMDLLMWRLSTDKELRTVENFFARTTSVQMALNTETQELAKSGYKLYWDEVVKGSKNTASTEDAKYREEYYNTSAGDKYRLLDDRLKEIAPADPKTGYTIKEIKDWMAMAE